MKLKPTSIHIVTQWNGSAYVAEVGGKPVSFSIVSAHSAAKKAAGDDYDVRESRPNIFQAILKEAN